jgi:hypothetical protein
LGWEELGSAPILGLGFITSWEQPCLQRKLPLRSRLQGASRRPNVNWENLGPHHTLEITQCPGPGRWSETQLRRQDPLARGKLRVVAGKDRIFKQREY